MRKTNVLARSLKLLVLCLVLVSGASAGQRAITKTRMIEIQRALNKQGYHVPVTGKMDSKTFGTLQQYQKDNHWQSKRVPDSRALIKLGLGPEYPSLLNPDTAWVAQ